MNSRTILWLRVSLILAVWTTSVAVFIRLGLAGLAIAAVVSAAASALVLTIRDSKAALSAAIAAIGSLIGAFFADLFLVSATVNRYDIKDFVRDGVVAAIGALAGGMFFSWASKR
jgi:hypothetical protein